MNDPQSEKELTMATEHSPLPWKVDYASMYLKDGRGFLLADCDQRSVPGPEAEINLALIVRAVNSHDKLMAALQQIHDVVLQAPLCSSSEHLFKITSKIYEIAIAVIVEVSKETPDGD